jgi:tetratricopeptide (TPR) repeat protein
MEELLRAISLVPDRSALGTADLTYLEAISAKVRREYPKAIEHYRELADRAADSEKASAYVDLGRAYEKNEEIDKAQEYYLQATKKDPQSAAAFLRLASLYGRRQDSKNAEGAFNEAEKIYKLMGAEEGRAEVFYQRGALLAKSKELSEARHRLEEALKISLAAANNYQVVRTQLYLSGVYYNEGDTERAKKVATDAIELAQKANIQSLATSGLIDLGYTLLSRGEFNEAGRLFRQALEFAQRDKARSSEARAMRALGSLNQQQGNADEAISMLEQALKFYQPAGYRREAAGALVLLGRAYSSKGDYEDAFKTFEQTLQLANDLSDRALMASSHSSIAILRGEKQERYPEALYHLDESFKVNQSINSKKDMGYDQMNRGAFLFQLGRYQEAREALDLAFKIANRPEASFKAVLAWVHLTNSQMALSERRFAEGKVMGQQALEAAGTEMRDVVVLAKCSIGRALANSGMTQQGRRLCEEAVALAREVNIPLLLSSALLSLSEVSLIGNDGQGALATALQAQAMFAQSGQQDSEWRALLVAARASHLAGNESAARDYATRADGLCTGLQQKWGAEAYDGYLRRPDIQTYRKQIGEILTRSK